MMPPDGEAPRPPRRFTVLLPVVRPPHVLPHAMRSVFSQTEDDFELCVICDGAPPETAVAARALADGDPRLHVFDLPKGKRHGEAHRAAVLRGARSRFVAQIGDDDLWFPDHLAWLGRLLAGADLASLPQVRVRATGWLDRISGDLADPGIRTRMLNETFNVFGPTEAGYRLDAYRRLPDGWSPAPADVPTDLFMWRKFLRQPGLRMRTGSRPTSLKFVPMDWDATPPEVRAEVIAGWAARLADPDARRALRREARWSGVGKVRLLRLVLREPAAGLPLAFRRLRHALKRWTRWRAR